MRWFAQTIVVPATLQDYALQGLSLRLALLWWAEVAQVFVNGQLVQEGDLFDCAPRLLLSPTVKPGDTFAIALRFLSPGHDDGALMKSVCHYETAALDAGPEPAFVADELAVLQTYLQTFAPEKLDALLSSVMQIDWSRVGDRTAFDQSLAHLRQQLLPLSPLCKQRTIHLLGHAHLDMAWLWSVEETWKAAERTFTSVLNLQKDFSELIFCHSTPALYEWMEQNRPQLFEQIRQQIQAGRWEVVGALWVEPELNLISGESIVRHILYGQRYLQAKFGHINRIAWLPDTFGFNWQLPQLLQQGGIDYFVTQKLRWNDTTQFPDDLFEWQAPDGSRVLSLMSAPIGEGIDPVKMASYACDWELKTGLPNALWLPGVGDHGGGPTRDMLEVARRWQQSPFFPKLEFTTAFEYLSQIELQTIQPQINCESSCESSAQVNPVSPSIWNHELYLEFHRGCYTTHADQKKFNRQSEALLYQAELWASLATLSANFVYPKAELELAWKQTLFNQFHDILPGSSIPQVFVDANQAWEAVEATCQKIREQALTAIAQQIALPSPPHPDAQVLVVFNSLNWPRSHVIRVNAIEPPESASALQWQVFDLEGQQVKFQTCFSPTVQECHRQISFLAEVPAIGYRCYWLCPCEKRAPAEQPQTEAYVLENEFLRVEVDSATGDLASVFDKTHQRQVLSGPGNQLQAFRDAGQYWDAWNIDPNYADHPLPPAELLGLRYLAQNDVETWIEVERQIGQSRLIQIYQLQAGSRVLTIDTRVNWQERHVLVKAAFPLNLQADFATYEIPCGAIERPTQPKTDRDQAKWEVPALGWADLSDETYGVSLLSDCKHGYDSKANQLRLTLLRGSEWPDPEADRGEHQFTYALYPHARSWKVAHTVQRAYELNQPLHWRTASPEKSSQVSTLPPNQTLLSLEAENLVLTALKQSEAAEDTWVLRCYECHGVQAQLNFQSPLNLQVQTAIDLLEQPIDTGKIQGPTAIVHPWKIVSFKVVANCD